MSEAKEEKEPSCEYEWMVCNYIFVHIIFPSDVLSYSFLFFLSSDTAVYGVQRRVWWVLQRERSFPSILYIWQTAWLRSVEDRLSQLLSVAKAQIGRGICTQVATCVSTMRLNVSWCNVGTKSLQDELIKSERERRIKRLHSHLQNDVWEKREKPPENWNDPLPEWMQKEFENSYLHIRNKEMKEGTEVSSLDTRCTIL